MSFDANNKKRQVKPVHGNDDGHKDDVGYQNNKDDHGEENEEVVYSTIEERQKDMDDEEQVYNEDEFADVDGASQEFFTLKCSGVPTYVKEAELIAHFATFGDLTDFKYNVHHSDEVAAASSEKKKIYNECIVQFWEAADAERCLNSPKSVLNNRFIKISINDDDLVSEEEMPEYPKHATSKRDKQGRSLSKVPKKVNPAIEKAKQIAAGMSPDAFSSRTFYFTF